MCRVTDGYADWPTDVPLYNGWMYLTPRMYQIPYIRTFRRMCTNTTVIFHHPSSVRYLSSFSYTDVWESESHAPTAANPSTRIAWERFGGGVLGVPAVHCYGRDGGYLICSCWWSAGYNWCCVCLRTSTSIALRNNHFQSNKLYRSKHLSFQVLTGSVLDLRDCAHAVTCVESDGKQHVLLEQVGA